MIVERLQPFLETARQLIASALFKQLVRFAAAGMGVTLFSASIYTAAAMLFHLPPLVANTISYACGLMAGYTIHSRWSFGADKSEGEGSMMARFFTASAIAFTLNSSWVWIATGFLQLSPLAPLPAMILVTPLVSFALNRYWVFRVA